MTTLCANHASLRESEANEAIQKNNNMGCHDSAHSAESRNDNKNTQNLAMTSDSSVDFAPKNQTDSAQKFKQLISKIYERDYELGELFSKNISFVSLENGVLTWESRADDTTKAKLKPYFKLIQEMLVEIFGKVQIQNKNAESSAKIAESGADSSKVVEMVESIFDITEKERV